MKKTTFSILSLFLVLLGASNWANAQDNRRSSFRVDAPAAIQGYLITSEIDQAGASPWGTSINSKWENFPVAYDQNNPDGCTPFTAGYFTGKFALIYRGTCEFGAKALAAQTAGAAGVIIVNNLLGVAGMGAGAQGAQVTIPVVMVTTQAGNDIRAQLLNNVPVNVSLTGWRFDSVANPIDIGFKNDGPVHPIAKTFPQHQCSTQMGNSDDSFKVYSGARLYNYSINQWDTLAQSGIISYNPSFLGGTFAPVDTVAINWFYTTPAVTTDSIVYVLIDSLNGAPTGFNMNDEALGRYKMDNAVNVVPFTETGLAPLDNTWSYTYAITDSIYSKCEYDFSKNAPTSNSYINVATTNNYQWGPVFYIRNPHYKAEKVTAVIMRDVIDDSLFTGQDVLVTLFRWDDVNGDNNIDYGSELEEVANATTQLTASDLVPIGGLPITMNFNNLVNPGQSVVLQQNSRYWMAISLGNNNTFAIGADYYADYTANLAWNVSRGNPLYDATGGVMYGGGFANAGSPALALHMSRLPVSVKDVAKFDGEANVYPNPASDIVNVSLTLNKISPKVTYEIVDVTGKSISISEKSNVTSDVFSYNTNKLSNGTYFVNINTESGKTQLKFVVTK